MNEFQESLCLGYKWGLQRWLPDIRIGEIDREREIYENICMMPRICREIFLAVGA